MLNQNLKGRGIMNIDRKELFSIPNCMGYFRIILIPFIAWAIVSGRGVVAALLIGLSGLTDFFDGRVARRFDMITEWGKFIDPVADKLTLGTIILCLAVTNPEIIILVIIFVLKEAYMAIMGIVLIKKNNTKLDGARWYGKCCTALLYFIMFLLILYPEFPKALKSGMVLAGAVAMVVTMLMYIQVFREMYHRA